MQKAIRLAQTKNLQVALLSLPSSNAMERAKFLFRNEALLDKAEIGDVLSSIQDKYFKQESTRAA